VLLIELTRERFQRLHEFELMILLSCPFEQAFGAALAARRIVEFHLLYERMPLFGERRRQKKFSKQHRANVRASTTRLLSSKSNTDSKFPTVRANSVSATTFGSWVPTALSNTVESSKMSWALAISRSASARQFSINVSIIAACHHWTY